MATESYFHTYKQYKAGTKQVIDWLVEKSGYLATIHTNSKSQNDTAVIPSAILPELARKAMKTLASTDTPRHLRTILSQVISARKECAAYHRNKMTVYTQQNQDNRGHEHFVQILEQVNDILGQTSNAAKSQSDPDAKLVNRFEYLEIEESIDQEAVVQDSNEPKHTKKIPNSKLNIPSKPQSIDDIEEDGLFAAFCFLVDCYRIRKYLCTVWQDYRNKKISLIAASLTTNMAFDVIAQIHFELSRDFPTFSEFRAITRASFDKDACENPIENYDISTMFAGVEAYVILDRMAEDMKAGRYPDFREQDNDMDWSKDYNTGVPMSMPRQKFRILMRALPDILFLTFGLKTIDLLDELSYSLYELCKPPHKINMSMIIACEIFIDIHYVLSADIGLPFSRLLEIGKGYKVQIQKNAILNKMFSIDHQPALINAYRGEVLELIDRVLENDIVVDCRKNMFGAKRENLTPFYILRHHPVLCGMLEFCIS